MIEKTYSILAVFSGNSALSADYTFQFEDDYGTSEEVTNWYHGFATANMLNGLSQQKGEIARLLKVEVLENGELLDVTEIANSLLRHHPNGDAPSVIHD